MPSLGDFFHTQFILKIPQPSESFASKTVIITGANGTLGKETATHIVRLGASKVILACRNKTKGNKVKAEIETGLKYSTNVIEVWEVDLESPPSIKKFVDQVNKLPRLDVLVNNAGIRAVNFQLAYDTESTIGVNTIGTFLLALQLIPKLKETARTYGVTPHMTFVTSALYDVAKYPEQHGDDIFAWYRDESHMNGLNQYNLSKLLQIYCIIELAAIVAPTSSQDSNQIVINSMDPCFCKTALCNGLSGWSKIAFRMFEFIAARTAEEGSRLVVQAAAAGRQSHGLYLRAGAVQQYAPIAIDKQKSEYVWGLLGKKLEELQLGILKNVQ